MCCMLCGMQTRLMAQQKSDGPARYKGLLDALVKIPAEEGFLAFYKGLLPRLLRIPPRPGYCLGRQRPDRGLL